MAGVVKNMMVRVGADFSSLFGEFKRANAKAKSEFAEMGKAAKSSTGMGTAFKSISADAVAELDRVKKQIEQLTAYSRNLEHTLSSALSGTAEESGLGKELDSVDAKIQALKGRAAVLGVQIEMNEENEQAVSWLDRFRDRLLNAMHIDEQFLSTHRSVWSAAGALVVRAGRSMLSGGINLLRSGISRAAAAARGFGTAMRAGFSGLGKLMSPVTRGISSIFGGLKRITGMSLGFGLSTSVVGRLKSVVSSYISENAQLKAQTEQLKASMGQALAPAINLVTNAMSALMPYIIGVSNAIGQLITNLFGSGWTTVAAGASAAAEATGAASAAQEEYNRQLAGFDEITKLSDSNSSGSSGGGGGGSAGSSTSPMEGKMPTWLTGIAEAVRASVEADDWSILGSEIARKISDVVATADKWINSIDFGKIGKNVAQGINGAVSVWMDDSEDHVSLGKLIADGLNGAIHFVTEGAENLDWANLGRWITKELRDLIVNIDWAGAFEGAGALIGGIATAIGQPIVDGIRSIGDYFAEEIEAAGGNVFAGILNGIVNGVSTIKTWIRENIFAPFLKGFKDTFNIHSPAENTELLDAAKNVALGILNGIAEPFMKAADWVDTNILTPIKNAITGANKPKVSIDADIANTAAAWWTKVKTWWNSAKGTQKLSSVSTTFATTTSAVKTWFTNVKTWWNKWRGGGKLSGVSTSLSTTASTVQGWWKNVSTWWLNSKKTLTSVSINATKGSGWANMSSWLGGLQKYISLSVEWKNPSGWIQEAISKYIFNSYGIPSLKFAARGGVVDRATLLGNNIVAGEAGAEMIMPLENNTRYLDILANQIASVLDARSSGSQTVNVNVVLDGKVVGKAAVKYINGQAIQTGRNPLAAYM